VDCNSSSKSKDFPTSASNIRPVKNNPHTRINPRIITADKSSRCTSRSTHKTSSSSKNEMRCETAKSVEKLQDIKSIFYSPEKDKQVFNRCLEQSCFQQPVFNDSFTNSAYANLLTNLPSSLTSISSYPDKRLMTWPQSGWLMPPSLVTWPSSSLGIIDYGATGMKPNSSERFFQQQSLLNQLNDKVSAKLPETHSKAKTMANRRHRNSEGSRNLEFVARNKFAIRKKASSRAVHRCDVTNVQRTTKTVSAAAKNVQQCLSEKSGGCNSNQPNKYLDIFQCERQRFVADTASCLPQCLMYNSVVAGTANSQLIQPLPLPLITIDSRGKTSHCGSTAYCSTNVMPTTLCTSTKYNPANTAANPTVTVADVSMLKLGPLSNAYEQPLDLSSRNKLNKRQH